MDKLQFLVLFPYKANACRTEDKTSKKEDMYSFCRTSGNPILNSENYCKDHCNASNISHKVVGATSRKGISNDWND